jgi:uncharacterized protein (TIGR04255 family)
VRQFSRYIGIDYSGAETPNSSLKGLRVYVATGTHEPVEALPPPSNKLYWTRRGLAEWLLEQLKGDAPIIVGIDHGFSFPLAYFERHGLLPDWYRFLHDFRKYWPTHEDHTYVDFLREGPRATGKARQGERAWRRLTEHAAGSAKSVFHFNVQGSVAKSTHSGIPWLLFLKERLGESVHIWPFDGWRPAPGKHVIVEVYPRLFSSQFANDAGRTGDQHDAFATAAWLRQRDADGTLSACFEPDLAPDIRHVAQVEGWIIGVMSAANLKHAATAASARYDTGREPPWRGTRRTHVDQQRLAASPSQEHMGESSAAKRASLQIDKMARPVDLPDFANPPLAEVAMSVQFQKLEQFQIVHAGTLWDVFRKDGDKVEYLPPLPPLFETFGSPSPVTQHFQFQLVNTPDLPRMWFVRENGEDLIQFQSDRFIHNWRKAGSDDSYPRYEAIRSQFLREFQKLETFIGDAGLGSIIPNQCELTYVNLIKPFNGDHPLVFAPPVSINASGALEDSSVSLRYKLVNLAGIQIGRLHIQTIPVIDPYGERALQLSITGRGPPAEPTILAVMGFLDTARAAIVRAFAEITSPAMHAVWDRKT